MAFCDTVRVVSMTAKASNRMLTARNVTPLGSVKRNISLILFNDPLKAKKKIYNSEGLHTFKETAQFIFIKSDDTGGSSCSAHHLTQVKKS